MDTSSVLGFVTIVFWLLCVVVAFSPLSWAVPAYLILAQMDVTPVGFEGGAEVGFANFVKIAVLPTVLYMRIRRGRSVENLRSLPFSGVWIAFICYVALASLWTAFPLPALKMLGFLYAYTLLFVIFADAWHSGTFNGSVITAIAWISLILAVIQSYVLGNAYGTPPGGSDYALQFTTFIDAQSFAPFLLVLLVFQILYGAKRWSKLVICACLIIAIVLAASRYVLASTAMSFLIVYAGRAYIRHSRAGLRTLVKAVTVTALLTVGLVWSVSRYFPTSRVNEALGAAISPAGSTDDVVNLAWRLQMYQEVQQAVETRGVRELFSGSGTSSGTVLRNNVVFAYDESTADANRVIHNEFLRALYEWGILGCGLLVVFLGSVFTSCVVTFWRTRSIPALVCLSVFPLLVAGLGIENVLSGSGRPNGVGFTLALAAFAASRVQGSESRVPAPAQSKLLYRSSNPTVCGLPEGDMP